MRRAGRGSRGRGTRAASPHTHLAGALSRERRSVRGALAPLLADPASGSIQISQLLGGHVVDVLDSHADWRFVTGADEYSGWVHEGYLNGAVADAFGPVPSGWRAADDLSLGCTARTLSGRLFRLPLGAHLPADSVIQTGEALPLKERLAAFPPRAAVILDSAERFFVGTPYVWGGVSPWGADCSGFVQSVLALHGIQLPRDAWQQATVGRLVEDRAALQAGDLLFFRGSGDPRITHVAMAIDGDAYMHLSVSRGGYAIERLDDSDAIARRLNASYRHARRVLPD